MRVAGKGAAGGIAASVFVAVGVGATVGALIVAWHTRLHTLLPDYPKYLDIADIERAFLAIVRQRAVAFLLIGCVSYLLPRRVLFDLLWVVGAVVLYATLDILAATMYGPDLAPVKQAVLHAWQTLDRVVVLPAILSGGAAGISSRVVARLWPAGPDTAVPQSNEVLASPRLRYVVSLGLVFLTGVAVAALVVLGQLRRMPRAETSLDPDLQASPGFAMTEVRGSPCGNGSDSCVELACTVANIGRDFGGMRLSGIVQPVDREALVQFVDVYLGAGESRTVSFSFENARPLAGGQNARCRLVPFEEVARDQE